MDLRAPKKVAVRFPDVLAKDNVAGAVENTIPSAILEKFLTSHIFLRGSYFPAPRLV